MANKRKKDGVSYELVGQHFGSELTAPLGTLGIGECRIRTRSYVIAAGKSAIGWAIIMTNIVGKTGVTPKTASETRGTRHNVVGELEDCGREAEVSVTVSHSLT